MTIYTIYRITCGHLSRYAAHTSRERAIDRAAYLNDGLSGLHVSVRYAVVPEFVDDSTE